MRYIIIFLFALMLSSCEPAPKQGKDGYIFGKKQYEQSPVTVNIITYKKQKELYQVAKSKGANYPKIVAFSVLSAKRDTCTIHMIDPNVSYEPEYVGHEFLHCAYGQWHTNNDSRN
jgi:hypothetical protein